MQWPRESSLGALFLITWSTVESRTARGGREDWLGVDRESFPNQLASPRNRLQWLRKKNMGSERERGAAVLADKGQGISEQKRTCKPKQVITLQKTGDQGMGTQQQLIILGRFICLPVSIKPKHETIVVRFKCKRWGSLLSCSYSNRLYDSIFSTDKAQNIRYR